MKTTFCWILLGGSLLLSGTSIFARPPGEEVLDPVRLALGKAPLAAPARRSADLGPSVVAPPQVTVHDVNPGAVVERDLCLTVAMGAGAAAECGDLRLVHVLPTVRTLSRARTPVLLYNSQHARPHALVAANVTLPQGTSGLQRVSATLWVDDRPRARSTWSGGGWPGSGPARIALGFDAQGEATAVKRFVLEVSAVYTTSTGEVTETTRAAGALAIVNRRNSPFGPGWWLAGLEQLLLDPRGKPDVWVGGDGSLRRLAAVPGTTDRWVTPAVDRPDTLKRDGSGYVRELPGGVQVRFDGRGRHVATLNRLGHETSFGYTGEGRLGSISVPPAGSGLSYAFVYGADGRLARVDAPGTGGAPRSVGLVRSGSQLTITDPDSTQVVLTHADGTGRRIVSRKNRLGHTTLFRYDAGGKIAASRLDLENGDSIVTRLYSAETRGLAEAVHVDNAFALLDGPRENTDALDHTRFWLDRFGAPRRIRNAMGHETVLTRGDVRFPALVTHTRSPNGLITQAWYNARGLPDSTRVESPYGDARNATTSYAYENAAWPEFVTRITQPEGEVVRMAYDSTGNRIWQQPGDSLSHRVTFQYYTDPAEPGAAVGLIKSVTLPAINGQSAVESFTYDAARGNLHTVRSPLGITTTFIKDALGRDEEIRTPIKADTVQVQKIRYTTADFVEQTQTIGPTVNGVAQQTVIVATRYDAEGGTRKVTRTMSPDPQNLGPLVSEWRYDAAGRVVAEIAPRAAGAPEQKDSTVYNAAGQPVRLVTRRDSVITMQYDALGRLETRRVPRMRYDSTGAGIPQRFFPDATVCQTTSITDLEIRHTYPRYPTASCGYETPEEVAHFGYDAMGNLREATNGDAEVKRTYYPNGMLQTDSLRIRPLAGEMATSPHVYGLHHTYDRNGRRKELFHPAQLVQGALNDRVRYRYDPETGTLAGVTDPGGNTFTHRFNARGELQEISQVPHSGGDAVFRQSFAYNDNGFLQHHRGWTAQRGWLYDMTLTYDAGGKVIEAVNTSGERMDARYSGLGHLVWTRDLSVNYVDGSALTYETVESFEYDALHNLLYGKTTSELKATNQYYVGHNSDRYQFYQAGTGRHVSSQGDGRVDELKYDKAGNLEFFTQSSGSNRDDRHSYYGADGKLRAVDRREAASEGDLNAYRTVFEEYRYDALGRRVLVDTRRYCKQTAGLIGECGMDFVRRTVWDADHELWEIQMPRDLADNDTAQVPDRSLSDGGSYVDPNPYWGRVSYTHGLSIDQPLSITRFGYADDLLTSTKDYPPRTVLPFAIIPLWDYRGQPVFGTYEFGQLKKCDSSDAEWCVYATWPLTHFAYGRSKITRNSWHGELLEDKQDHTGNLYRRNRYYDPSNGRFTQEDPIGLAGGLNVYGFANGDPVSYSDPYGLCPGCGRATQGGGRVDLSAKPSFREQMMQLGETLRGASVRNTIAEHDQDIAAAAHAHGVDAGLIKGIIYEEQTHQTPFEGFLEARGMGSTVGLGQVTVGKHGYSRQQLLDPTANIQAIATHLGSLQEQGLIDTSRPTASLATKYNCGSCSSISGYGERVEKYRQQLFSSP